MLSSADTEVGVRALFTAETQVEPLCKILSTLPSRAGGLETKSPSLQCHRPLLRHGRLYGQATRCDTQLWVHEASCEMSPLIKEWGTVAHISGPKQSGRGSQ